ncbi:MAG: C45 family autoproteolytic acyltransferase/hydrolase [Kofleriaceae bacterium]
MSKSLLLARLTGTQAQMGAQHGRLTAACAARLLGFYRTMPERSLAGGGPRAGRFVVRKLASAWQARLARDRPPELAARTEAFIRSVAAEVPGHDTREARLTFATMDSLQNCVALAARIQLGPFANPITARAAAAAVPACSTLITWGDATEDGELLFGRNFDFPGVGVWDASPAFVTCVPDRGQRYGFFTTRGADTAVVTVINEAGLVMAPHTRWHRGITWGGAMIVDLVHEIARRAETLEDAIAIARERPASSSWGLAIGSARERSAIVLELAGRAVDVVRPRAGASYVACANRYRTASMQAGELAASTAWAVHSDRREQRLRALIEARPAPLVARDVARFLGDRIDPAAPERRRHLGGILAQPTNVHCVVVAPTTRRAWVGIDRAPACEGSWAEVDWQWDGPQGGWELDQLDELAGFRARVVSDFVQPHDAATRHVHEASRAYETSHDVPTARAAIERAVGADPDDPSLRLAAAWLALEAGAEDRAIIHTHAGLAFETEPFRRGQLLAWGARAAHRTDPALATRWRDELGRLVGDGLDELRAIAGKRGKPRVNLMMVDAY